MRLQIAVSTALSLLIVGVSPAHSADEVNFEERVKPILEQSCLKCHNEEKAEGNLRLHTREAALEGGDSGAAVVPEKPGESLLHERVALPADSLLRMPAEGDPLGDEQVAVLEEWIKQGAPWPEDVTLTPGGASQETMTDEAAVTRELTEAEKRAIARIREEGGQVLELAQNDRRVVVNYHLADEKVTDEHLAPLAELGELVYEINLRGTGITDEGLGQLGNLTALKRLHLEQTGVTDAGLAHLKGLENLEYLNVYGTSVTDAGLDHLKGLGSLRKVYIWQSGVTAEGVKEFRDALAEVQVIPDLWKQRQEALAKAEAKPVEAPKPEAPDSDDKAQQKED